jgi:hypothetical protein
MPSTRKNIEFNQGIDTFESRSFPMPASGALRLFCDAANASSRFDITSLALGGAVSFMSAILSNRIRLNNTWPNTYIVGLGKSGMGKGSVVDLLKELLSGTDLLGADMYRSSQAFIQNLPHQQQRLDVIDEAAPFFESMKSTANYTSDLVDVVNRLFSLGATRFDGISSAKHGKKSGACWNPCISIYATVHNAGFMKSVQGYLGTSGLMPRFLIFEQSDIKMHDNKLNDLERSFAVEGLKSFIKEFMALNPFYKEQQGLNLMEDQSIRMFPRTLTMDQKAKSLIDAYDKSTALKLMSFNEESIETPYMARLLEIALKITMIHCVSNKKDFITAEDAEYGIALVEAVYHNSQLIRRAVSNSGKVSGPWAKIESLLRRRGKTTHSDLQRLTDITKRELDPILDTMIEAGSLCVESERTGGGRMRRSYYIPSIRLQ